MNRSSRARKQYRSGGKFAKTPNLKEQGYDVADGTIKTCAECGKQAYPIMNTWRCQECGHRH